MYGIRRVRPSSAVAIAVLALIAALAGTALAGSGPTANPAGKADKALKKAKKANRTAKANAALLEDLCGDGASAAGIETCTAPTGPTGPTGAAGAAGEPGADALNVSSLATGIVKGIGTADTTEFAVPIGASDVGSESAATTLSPNTGPTLIDDFVVELDAAPGASKSVTFFIRVDVGGAIDGLECEIAGIETSCSSEETLALPAATPMSIKVVSVGAPASSVARYGYSNRVLS